MMGLGMLIKRNIKMFFKDKGLFFTSLITKKHFLIFIVQFLYNTYMSFIFFLFIQLLSNSIAHPLNNLCMHLAVFCMSAHNL